MGSIANRCDGLLGSPKSRVPPCPLRLPRTRKRPKNDARNKLPSSPAKRRPLRPLLPTTRPVMTGLPKKQQQTSNKEGIQQLAASPSANLKNKKPYNAASMDSGRR